MHLPRVVVLMDPPEHCNPKKDSTLAMVEAAQRRGWPVWCLLAGGLALVDGRVSATARPFRIDLGLQPWFELGAAEPLWLGAGDLVLARRDPPFDVEYLHDTHLLDVAEAAGALVVNRPQSLRDLNEKLATQLFPALCPPTCVSRDAAVLKDFVAGQGACVGKILDAMGGRSIFRLASSDPNLNVILETLTDDGRRLALVQRYLPEIVEGDKRVLVIDGEAAPWLLARLPQGDEFRGNLARGGRGEVRALGEAELKIVETLGPWLRARGLYFVGLDVIGDRLTEINVTSPTCVREIAAATGYDAAEVLFQRLDARLRGG
ncbi:MAG: glutathione synthase [Xanthomonadales bacterium]|jgi:glutathione synthase|nr:glutathione synthase [Xanthomonadales bacterium]